MGTYYPAEDDHCFNSTKCPLFWQHHKISVVPVNFSNEDYIDRIRIAAMTGMSFNILAVFVSAIFLINGLRKNDDFVDGVEQMDKPKDKVDPNSVLLNETSTNPGQIPDHGPDQQILVENPDDVPKSGSKIWIFRPSMLVGIHK